MNHDKVTWVWSQNDFEGMNWHDVYVYAVAYDYDRNVLMFDLDYIVEWISPSPTRSHFLFQVAPATLVFNGVSHFNIQIDAYGYTGIMTIEDVIREYNAEDQSWSWLVNSQSGETTFQASGYSLFIRQPPVESQTQMLGLDARGGISFAQTTPHNLDYQPSILLYVCQPPQGSHPPHVTASTPAVHPSQLTTLLNLSILLLYTLLTILLTWPLVGQLAGSTLFGGRDWQEHSVRLGRQQLTLTV